MKTKKLSLLAIAAVALCFSCTKENVVQNSEPDQRGPFEVTITGQMGEFAPSTKSAAESCIRLKWSAYDRVWAYDGDGNPLGGLTVTVDEGNDYVAKMSGTLSSVPSDGYLYLVHSPILSVAVQPTADDLSSISMVGQSSNVIPFVAYAVVKDVTATPQAELKAKFCFATSILRINATGLINGRALHYAELSSISTACALSISGKNKKFVVSSGKAECDYIRKTLTGTTVSSAGRASFYVGVPIFYDKTDDRVLKVSAEGPDGTSLYYDYGVVAEGKAENSYVNYVYEVKELYYIDEYGRNRGSGTYIASTHAVWAPVNCGCNYSYKYGKLYQWGRKFGCGYVSTSSTTDNDAGGVIQEVTSGPVASNLDDPYSYYTVTSGDWSTAHSYNYWDLSLAGSYTASGHVPTRSKKDPCPEGWRVPTYAELAALIKGSTVSGNFIEQTETIQGVAQKGHWFDGTGSASATTGVFLSAAGRRSYSAGKADYRGTFGAYWCSSASSESNARYFVLSSSTAKMDTYHRAAGCSIRCVME